MTGSHKGSLLSLRDNTEFNFSSSPRMINFSRRFDFDVNPILGEGTSVVSYCSTRPKELKVDLSISDDVTSDNDCLKVIDLFEKASVIEESTKSVSKIRFKYGTLELTGYIEDYFVDYLKFNTEGNPSEIQLSFHLLEAPEEK